MSQCSDGPERRDGRDDAEEDVTDDGKVRCCDKVGVPLVITAYHDQAALRYAVRYEDVHDGLVPRPRIEGCKGVWKNKAGYTACGWAGAMFEVTRPFRQEQ